MTVHRYATTLAWTGSTGLGYDRYDRSHAAHVDRAGVSLTLSSDQAFGGDPARANPEQLLLLAASSCQLLSFLAAAARARVDVVDYHDDATAEMPDEERPVRITRITLRPRITVRGDVSEHRVLHLVEVGHRECFVANSITTEITIEPEVTRVAS
jgi:organic hydroperoxide reductase OsmC/OhrA